MAENKRKKHYNIVTNKMESDQFCISHTINLKLLNKYINWFNRNYPNGRQEGKPLGTNGTRCFEYMLSKLTLLETSLGFESDFIDRLEANGVDNSGIEIKECIKRYNQHVESYIKIKNECEDVLQRLGLISKKIIHNDKIKE